MASKYRLTPDQLALQEERKRKRVEKQAIATNGTPNIPTTGKDAIIIRDWLRRREPRTNESSLKIMNWNILAQTLVRRELFPSSDCLKGSHREGMLPNEILAYDPDVSCFQEVDRLEKLLPPLRLRGYAYTYATGRGKRHGCMIIHKETKLEKLHERTVHFDECNLHESTTTGEESPEEMRKLKGSSRRTKNIALMVVLRRKSATEPSNCDVAGYIVATTHLFWHPRYVYERVRQGAILLREISRFQEETDTQNWPVLLAGDFNSQPSEALYALLVGDTPSPSQIGDIEASRVVHASLDSSIKFEPNFSGVSTAAIPTSTSTPNPTSSTTPGGNESSAPSIVGEQTEDNDDGEGEGVGEDEGGDPDRVLVNCRPARFPEDGLMSASELINLFTSLPLPPLRSAYDSSYQSVLSASCDIDNDTRLKESVKTFSNRPRGGSTNAEDRWDADKKGANEPMYTSFTHYWRLTLDYIFLQSGFAPASHLMPSDHPPTGEVIALLRTHDASDLEPGLPKKGVNASDHISLVAEIDF